MVDREEQAVAGCSRNMDNDVLCCCILVHFIDREISQAVYEMQLGKRPVPLLLSLPLPPPRCHAPPVLHPPEGRGQPGAASGPGVE